MILSLFFISLKFDIVLRRETQLKNKHAIYKYTLIKEIFTPELFPALEDWVNFNASYYMYLSLNTTVFGQIQDWANYFASLKGLKLHGAKITMYTSSKISF